MHNLIIYKYKVIIYINIWHCRSEEFRSHRAEALQKKYDLTKWKYAELRDTINTSCGQ
jgi:hypothetical protein